MTITLEEIRFELQEFRSAFRSFVDNDHQHLANQVDHLARLIHGEENKMNSGGMKADVQKNTEFRKKYELILENLEINTRASEKLYHSFRRFAFLISGLIGLITLLQILLNLSKLFPG
ncbi:MAG TPA: hypothetical protein VKA68_16290 [bacterium]|nr:hypothetical protein [bacterium]